MQERASVAALAHIFPPDLYPYPREAVRARWAAALVQPETRALIAVSGDEPVGAACVMDGWLEGFYVVPERWGSGLADELHEDNVRARRFYERRGWRENGDSRIVEFSPNPLDIGYSLDF